MSPKRKPPKHFVSASYARSKWAIAQVEKLLKQQNYAIILKEEDYGPDIKAIKDSVIELYEVETKTQYTWTNEHDFPFTTVSFLARKEKWKDLGFWYILVCTETKACIKCHSSVIFQEKFKEEQNQFKREIGQGYFLSSS